MKNHKSKKAVTEPYESAVREFIKDTIHNKEFFQLPSSEQKKMAMDYLRKNKNENER